MNAIVLITLLLALSDLLKADAFINPSTRHSFPASRPFEGTQFLSKPFHQEGDFSPDDQHEKHTRHNDFEEFFRLQKPGELKPPPQRFYKDLDNPIDKLEEFLEKHESRVAYNAASDQVKAYLLYVAAHSCEDKPNVGLLNDSEWRELFHSILNDGKSQEVMQSIMADENKCPSSSFPSDTQKEKLLNKWRRRVWIDKSIIGIIQRPLRRRDRSFGVVPGLFRPKRFRLWWPSICSVALDKEDPPIQIVHSEIYSFMPAVILFLAYNEKFHSPAGTWKRIPMDQILSHAYDQRMIYDRIVKNKGCSSFDYLKTFLVQKYDILRDWIWLDYKSDPEQLVDAVEKYGAALISNFDVGRDFFEPNKFSYDGKPAGRAYFIKKHPSGEYEEYGGLVSHAMLLVGARLDRKGKCWLLVQNSWSSKQFVEMSLDYFCECDPEVHFPLRKLELKGVFKPVPQQSIQFGFNDRGDGLIRTEKTWRTADRPDYER